MRQAIWTGLLAALLAVLTPALLTAPIPEPEPETVALVIEPAAQETKTRQERTVRVKNGREILEVSLGEYLTGVVLSEMPASFEPEALKAQAVAARTFALRQMEGGKHTDCDLCADGSCCQAWSSREAMEQKLGDGWLRYWRKAEEAVTQTAGEVLTYEGELIDAVYFSCSGGATEDAVAVWGSEVPYLQSVPSRGEEDAPPFESEAVIPLAKFRSVILEENPQADLSGPASGWFGALTQTEGGGVDTLEIGGQPFSGTRLRAMFGLRSAKFSAAAAGEEIVFQVSGYGHRVGMSQYGANAMAKSGSSYREILQHYYTGVTIETKTP